MIDELRLRRYSRQIKQGYNDKIKEKSHLFI